MNRRGIARRTALSAWLGLLACREAHERPVPTTARIISISPSTTESVFAVGAGSLLVGRSRFCDYPSEALTLPSVGGFADPSIEAILALKPTLVLGAHGPAGPTFEVELRSHGIDTFFPETESVDQTVAMIVELGNKLGVPEKASSVASTLRSTCQKVEAENGSGSHPRVVLLFDTAPLIAAGPGSFPDELLRRAGAENAVKAGGAYPTLGMEQLLAMDPDVVIDGSTEAQTTNPEVRLGTLKGKAGFERLRAARTDQVAVLSDSAALRPGPRICDGVATLAKLIHKNRPRTQ